MNAAPLTATGLLAHAVHLGLILGGTGGVIALLAPGWRAARTERRAPTSHLTHDERVDALLATLGDPHGSEPLAAEAHPPRPVGDSR